MIIVCKLWWVWWGLHDWNDRFNNCSSCCHDLDDNYDDGDYHDSCNDYDDCFDDLRMILTLEGFLHLSISRLTACRPPCSRDHYTHLQQRANPFEKQELGNLWIQAPTTSPAEDTKFAQAWFSLAVSRSGREPRCLPWESYLGQKADCGSGWDQKLVHLSTCPWVVPLLPPIMTSSCWNLTAQVRYPPFWRLNTVPPVVSIIPVFYRFSKRCVSCLYHIVNLPGTISPLVKLLSYPPTITMLSSSITTAAW